MTPKEKKLLQGFIDNVYEQFVTAVAEGRQIPEEEVRAIADGRIFSGEQAHELGLLDSLGSMEDAVALAAQLAGIEGEPSVVYGETKKFSLLEFLLGSRVSDAIDRITGGALHSGYLYVPGRGVDNG
jgi:protease-4